MSGTAGDQPAGIQKSGLYVIVSDMDRSRAFYERVFGQPPVMQNDRIFAGIVRRDACAAMSRCCGSVCAHPAGGARLYQMRVRQTLEKRRTP
jgi:catechol 2,3-dioxygenase-like lactoylglutathione lyase family enzyme